MEKTAIAFGPMGIGTNVWGRGGRPSPGVVEVFDAALEAGIGLIDSAELYQGGGSERSIALALAKLRSAAERNPAADRSLTAERSPATELGENMPADVQPIILSKFFPWPWRLSRRSLESALKRSLGRLGIPRLDVYLLHFPFPPVRLETWAEALADAAEAGLTRAVGISNCDASQVRRAHEVLARRGIPLACDEVEFSLLDRRAERNGTLAACRELGIATIAYRPLGSGILPTAAPTTLGLRKLMAPRTDARGLEALRKLLASIGARGGKTAAQVALNWTMMKGTIPIPGARTVAHLEENAGALGWKLESRDVEALDQAADRVANA